MVLQVSPEIQSRIEEFTATGDYDSVDSVLDDALTLLDLRRQHEHLKELLAETEESVANGDLVPFDAEFVAAARRRAFERFEAGEEAGPDVRP